VSRYLRLLLVQFRVSAATAMQYRVEFAVEGALAVFWAAWSVVPVLVLFGHKPLVAGWRFEEALVVLGWFTLMKGVLEGAVNPSLASVVEHIRKGSLDFILLKPADAQFLVSTAKFQPWRAIDGLAALAIFGVAFHRLGRSPSAGHVAAALALLFCAAWTLYSLWILVVSAAFHVVKIDNLSYLFSSLFDAARWPASVFRGVWRVLFTIVVPLALMTTYPALALLGRLDLPTALWAVGGSALFAAFARVVWLASLGRYTSASS
jgi:ABC-2 type transport system permease protein